MKKLFTIISIALIIASCGEETENPEVPPTLPVSTVKNITYTPIGEYPHDTASFTQGLEIHNGKLYESTGDFENSAIQFGTLRAKNVSIEKKFKMGSDKIFGEGLTFLKGKAYQITWQTHEVFVYDEKDITKPIQKMTWALDGWGITNDGTDLIITSGGSDLYFVAPTTFKIKNTVHIHDDNGPVDSVNELEYVDGYVWGNIWLTNNIVKIDAKTGAVVGKMSFNNLLTPNDVIGNSGEKTMNGIAYDSTSKTFFVTGKRWPKIFEIRLN
jgi:glutaminyl-peptide cyclotransferase